MVLSTWYFFCLEKKTQDASVFDKSKICERFHEIDNDVDEHNAVVVLLIPQPFYERFAVKQF